MAALYVPEKFRGVRMKRFLAGLALRSSKTAVMKQIQGVIRKPLTEGLKIL